MGDNSKSGVKTETRVCRRCKKMFNYPGFGHLYCQICREVENREFEKVRDYIYEHGVATAQEVSEHTNVSMTAIDRYLREGRLEIPENSPIYINCIKCAAHIRSGRYCQECAATLSHAMRVELNFSEDEIGDKPKTKKVEKMRFLDRN